MDIIFSRQTAEELSEKYVVLELESHLVEDKILETFCVIDAKKIPLNEIPMMDHWKKLHNEFVKANKDKNAKLCVDLAEHLKGKFGGDLDEFYSIVCERFNDTHNV
jgi:hypothetical protein